MILNVCYSGGAKGADTLFGECATAAGHLICHWSFQWHNYKGPHRFILNENQLKSADTFLSKANETLKRCFPTNSEYTNNLLRRNYFQVKGSDRVYAVGHQNINTHEILGGTAWALQMAIDTGVPEIYFYNQMSKGWFEYRLEQKPYVAAGFYEMRENPPKPHGVYTGIGTRDLSNDGQDAIKELYRDR